jgi:2-amino-4-hydroxy-6-hydroxymethyldihydropteridine diphosphokinase
LNASGSKAKAFVAHIGLGSNIDPEVNLVKAAQRLREELAVSCASSVWRSPAEGTDGPDFLNAVVTITTELDAERLKHEILRLIEAELGRTRGLDKYAPRTIDLDILVFDGQILDNEIWAQPYLAIPLAECAPDLQAKDGERLSDLAGKHRNGQISKIDLEI